MKYFISCHACHPSLCNDNLSGIALTMCLAKYLRRVAALLISVFLYSWDYWFRLHGFANNARSARIKHGLVVGVWADPGQSDV